MLSGDNNPVKAKADAEPKKAISYIRFSTTAQGIQGKDSQIRQVRAINAALQKHGLVLDQEFHDRGRSAYHQRHIAEGGALHELRRLAVAGALKGKVLVLENWDRAGRLQVTDAAPLLMDMLNNGVELVVGSDGGEYFSRESVNANPFLLYRSLDEMNRGFGESRRKSDMAKHKWQTRREAVAKGEFKPLGSLPWWLENGKDAYVVKPGMRELIRRIFDLYLGGKGSQIIAKEFNAKNVPLPPNKDGSVRKNANGWHPTYIQNLIKNRALIGYYFKTDYKIFPPIVSEKDFYTANAKRKERVHFAGRKAEHINPVAGLVYCAKCGGHIITHHSGVKKYGKRRYSYMMCGESRRGKCSAAGIPWEIFEESFSVIWEDKEMANAFMGDDEMTASRLTELQGRLGVVVSRVRQVEADYAESPSTPLARILAKLEAEEAELRKELEAVTIAERGAVSQSDAYRAFKDIFLSDDWEEPEVRLMAQECLRNMVDRIIIDIPRRCYAVHFKGKKEPMQVTDLRAEDCKINGIYYRLLKGILKYEDLPREKAKQEAARKAKQEATRM